MRVVIALASVVAMSIAGSARGETSLPVLLQKCGSTPACIPMLLDKSAKAGKIVISSREPPDGYTEFTLKVRGRLAGGDAADLRVLFRGFTDGIACSEFGQGNVAVLGFTTTSHPVVLTDRGALVLEDDELVVGCPGCANVVETHSGKVVGTFTSPAWDLTLAGFHDDSFFVGSAGELYLRSESACLPLSEVGLFTGVDIERCRAIPSGKFRVELERWACT
jgi:hypothetical protein